MPAHNIFTVMVCLCASSLLLADNNPVIKGDRAVLKEPPERLVEWIDSSIREVSSCAAINVMRDATQQRVRIFATSWPDKRVTVKKVGEFEVETVFGFGLLAEQSTAPACYHTVHNSHVLALAGSLIVSGKKEQGLELVRLVARAQPGLCFLPSEPPVLVGDVLNSLEKEDEMAANYLKTLNYRWEYHKKQQRE